MMTLILPDHSSSSATFDFGITPLPRFDPSFVILAMFASVEAIDLSTFVLASIREMQQAWSVEVTGQNVYA